MRLVQLMVVYRSAMLHLERRRFISTRIPTPFYLLYSSHVSVESIATKVHRPSVP